MPSGKLITAPALITNRGEHPAMADWRVRAIVHTLPATGLGMMVRAVLGQGRRWLPRLGLQARIAATGIVHCDFWDDDGSFLKDDDLPLTVIQVRDEFRRLADALKFTDAERIDMTTRLQKWLGKDERPDHRHVETGS